MHFHYPFFNLVYEATYRRGRFLNKLLAFRFLQYFSHPLLCSLSHRCKDCGGHKSISAGMLPGINSWYLYSGLFPVIFCDAFSYPLFCSESLLWWRLLCPIISTIKIKLDCRKELCWSSEEAVVDYFLRSRNHYHEETCKLSGINNDFRLV